VVWSVNALDHSYNPVTIIEQCLDVVKIGSDVFLSHLENEAEAESYVGLHQWNFCCDDGAFVIWNKRQRINVSKLLSPYSNVTCQASKGGVNTTLHKLRDRPENILKTVQTRLNRLIRVFDPPYDITLVRRMIDCVRRADEP
jgi:hypothetical protein